MRLPCCRVRGDSSYLYRGKRLHESNGLPLGRSQYLAFPHDTASTDDRAPDAANDLHAVIRRPAGPALHPAIGQPVAPLEIDDGEIGIIPFRDTTLAGQAENAPRSMARQIDKPFEREAALVHVIKHDRHQSLDTGHARRRFRIWLGLFL